MVEDATNKLAPPTFVIVFARPINCRSRRHFFPSRVKRLFEFLRIQFQTNLMTDQSVMVAYGLREKKERPGSVEKDCFDHSVSGSAISCSHDQPQNSEHNERKRQPGQN